jgi:hypothetical protein
MDQSTAPDLRLIPYAQASPAQLTQALVTAREALAPYYPALTWPQWHQAFEYLQPTLRLEASQVSLTGDGLTELAHYFDAQHPSPTPTSQVLPVSQRMVKMTYSMRPDVLESLNRVSFWRRKGKSALVNIALKRFLSGYSESQDPIPVSDFNTLSPTTYVYLFFTDHSITANWGAV